MSEKKKADEKENLDEVKPKVLEQLILERTEGKYALVPLVALWAKELRKKEELRHLSTAATLDQALRDVLEGGVTWKTLKRTSPEEKAAAKAKK